MPEYAEFCPCTADFCGYNFTDMDFDALSGNEARILADMLARGAGRAESSGQHDMAREALSLAWDAYGYADEF